MSGQAATLPDDAVQNGTKAARFLSNAAVFWFITAVAGQWTFVYYITAFYGPSALSGDYSAWDRNKGMTDGYVAGDVPGNLFFLAHVLLAAVLTLGGTLQLIPQIRTYAIWLHRLNGRLFLIAATAAAIAGLYLQWIRGTALRSETGLVSAYATTLDGVLILLFAALAYRAARAKRIDVHQRWATRLFLVVNGVWFLRVGYMAWVVLTQGVFRGFPFFTYWSYGAFLVPLAIYELYWRAKAGPPLAQRTMASALILLSLAMAAGEVAAFLFMWQPLLTASAP